MIVVSPKDGKPVMIDHHTPFAVLSLARLKGVKRMVGAEASRMEALQRAREFGGDIDHMISATLQGSDMEQLEHLAYLIDDLMGDVKAALSIHKRMFELDEASVHLQIRYGLALQKAGQLSEAELVFRTALSFSRSQLSDPMNQYTLMLMGNLASLLQVQGKLSEAEPLCRETLDERRQLLGNSHPDTLSSISNLASLFRAQGKLAEAEPLFREALEERRQLLGNFHSDTRVSISNLAALLQAQGKLAEAEPLCRETLDGSRQLLGNSHPSTLTSQGKLAEAESLFRETLAGRRQLLGNSHLTL